MRVDVFGVDEIAPGQVRRVRVGPVDVVLVRRADGSFRALRDRCSHQGGALSGGRLEAMVVGDRLGEYRFSERRMVLRCPLHQFEFDVDTGRSPADPERYRVRSYPVTVENGRVFIER